MPKYWASHDVQAHMMTAVAAYPGELTRPDVLLRMNLQQNSMMQASYVLQDRGLLRESEIRLSPRQRGLTIRGGRTAPLLLPTKLFWDTYEEVSHEPAQLWPDYDWRLYEDAVRHKDAAAYIVNPVTTRPSLKRDKAISVIVGHAEVLGQRHNLNRSGDWFDGAPGIRAAIILNALGAVPPTE